MNESSLPEAVRREIDTWSRKFPAERKQSVVLYGLRIAQEVNGWLSEDTIKAVADYIGIPHIAAFEVATFYSMYDLKPRGKYKIGVCNSISCLLCGSQKLIKHLETELGIKAGETTADGLFTLKVVECLAACKGAPAMIINDKHYHENLTPEQATKLLAELAEQTS